MAASGSASSPQPQAPRASGVPVEIVAYMLQAAMKVAPTDEYAVVAERIQSLVACGRHTAHAVYSEEALSKLAATEVMLHSAHSAYGFDRGVVVCIRDICHVVLELMCALEPTSGYFRDARAIEAAQAGNLDVQASKLHGRVHECMQILAKAEAYAHSIDSGCLAACERTTPRTVAKVGEDPPDAVSACGNPVDVLRASVKALGTVVRSLATEMSVVFVQDSDSPEEAEEETTRAAYVAMNPFGIEDRKQGGYMLESLGVRVLACLGVMLDRVERRDEGVETVHLLYGKAGTEAPKTEPSAPLVPSLHTTLSCIATSMLTECCVLVACAVALLLSGNTAVRTQASDHVVGNTTSAPPSPSEVAPPSSAAIPETFEVSGMHQSHVYFVDAEGKLASAQFLSNWVPVYSRIAAQIITDGSGASDADAKLDAVALLGHDLSPNYLEGPPLGEPKILGRTLCALEGLIWNDLAPPPTPFHMPASVYAYMGHGCGIKSMHPAFAQHAALVVIAAEAHVAKRRK